VKNLFTIASYHIDEIALAQAMLSGVSVLQNDAEQRREEINSMQISVDKRRKTMLSYYQKKIKTEESRGKTC
jgi:hypothetical protein